MAALDLGRHMPPARYVWGIADVYPPLQFTKNPPAYGWPRHILTASNGCFLAARGSLAANLSAHGEVTRARPLAIAHLGLLRHLRQRQSRNPHDRLPAHPAIPQRLCRTWALVRCTLGLDPQLGSMPCVLRNALQICRMKLVDARWTTSASYSCHLLGLLFRHLVGPPGVANFCDAWANNTMAHLPHRAVHAWLEARVVQGADRVVSVAPAITAAFARKQSGPSHRYMAIANGFDDDSVPVGIAQLRQPTRQAWAPFVLLMAGRLFGRLSAMPSYKRLAQFLNGHLGGRRVTQVRWVGQPNCNARHKWQRAMARLSLGVGDVIEALCAVGVLPLLLRAGAGAEQVMTGKMFEYHAKQQRSRAMAQGTAQAELAQRCQAGITTHPQDTKCIAQAVGALFGRRHLLWRNQATGQAALLPYTRRALLGQLAALLDDVTQPKRPS